MAKAENLQGDRVPPWPPSHPLSLGDLLHLIPVADLLKSVPSEWKDRRKMFLHMEHLEELSRIMLRHMLDDVSCLIKRMMANSHWIAACKSSFAYFDYAQFGYLFSIFRLKRRMICVLWRRCCVQIGASVASCPTSHTSNQQMSILERIGAMRKNWAGHSSTATANLIGHKTWPNRWDWCGDVVSGWLRLNIKNYCRDRTSHLDNFFMFMIIYLYIFIFVRKNIDLVRCFQIKALAMVVL